MQHKLSIDLESFSEADIREVGAARYANDPSTEILIAAFSLNGEEPYAWVQGEELPEKYQDALLDGSIQTWAHNASFEMFMFIALSMKTWGIPSPDLSRWRCTASMGRRAALPAKLETLAEVLGLDQQKDKRGAALIRKFSIIQHPRATKKNPDPKPFRLYPKDDPEAFAEFVEYCKQDVRTEQAIAQKLAYFDEPINNANYTLDARINARGFPVNLKGLRNAGALIEEETEILSRQFRELTGFEITQNARLLEWINGFKSFNFENLQAETIEKFLAPFEGKKTDLLIVEALRLKQRSSYASIKKIAKMLECYGPHDNRIRGTLIHHGAGTGRWTASLVQPQNLKRPTIKDSEQAYREICEGTTREMLEICHGPVLEVLSSCIRHFIHDTNECPECLGFGDCGACDGDGNQESPMLDADYAAIEARVVNWLAGQEDALERFRAYDRAPEGSELKKSLDPYRIMAADVYRKPVKEVLKFPDRFVGKGLVLGAGFKLSGSGFKRQCMDQAGYDISEEDADKAIKLWRSKHKKVVAWWEQLDKASKAAIVNKGKWYPAGKVSFCCMVLEGITYLLMRLPSGRKISYPRPRLVPGKFEGTTQIEYYGNIKGAMWGWCRLWEGVLANNATQGTANDVMFAGAHNCERAGYHIFNVIHDQALAPARNPEHSSDTFARLLTTLPEWAVGLPIAAEGGVVPFYRKD